MPATATSSVALCVADGDVPRHHLYASTGLYRREWDLPRSKLEHVIWRAGSRVTSPPLTRALAHAGRHICPPATRGFEIDPLIVDESTADAAAA